MRRNNGGSAFPLGKTESMSLRDWFAGQVIVGLIPDAVENDVSRATLAQRAYEMADAMLRQRVHGTEDS